MRRIEDFTAPTGGDGERTPGRSEATCSWKAAPQRRGSEGVELTRPVPPPGRIHLAVTRDDDAELQKEL